MSDERESQPIESSEEASRRGLESLHDGQPHPTQGEVLPEHDPRTGTPSPGERHRGGPLPSEKN